MAVAGYKKGPRESPIPGCSDRSTVALQESISHYVGSDMRGEDVPAHVDDAGQPYMVFFSPDSCKLRRIYLEEQGYRFHGDIGTFTEAQKTF